MVGLRNDLFVMLCHCKGETGLLGLMSRLEAAQAGSATLLQQHPQPPPQQQQQPQPPLLAPLLAQHQQQHLRASGPEDEAEDAFAGDSFEAPARSAAGGTLAGGRAHSAPVRRSGPGGASGGGGGGGGGTGGTIGGPSEMYVQGSALLTSKDDAADTLRAINGAVYGAGGADR